MLPFICRPRFELTCASHRRDLTQKPNRISQFAISSPIPYVKIPRCGFLDHVSDVSDVRNRKFLCDKWVNTVGDSQRQVRRGGSFITSTCWPLASASPGFTPRWANGDEEVTQAQPPQEGPAWNLPDAPAFNQGRRQEKWFPATLFSHHVLMDI